MAGKTVVVFSCAHVDPTVSNERFNWLGEFLYDLKPDYVVDLGDGADMRSLNTFDTRYPEAIVSQSYEADIEHYNDAQERIRWKFRHHKRKRPTYIGFEGNHENRIKKAIKHDPRLEGSKYGISFGHLRRTDGSMSTTSMNTPRQRLLITMASRMLTSLVVVTLGLLCLVCTMLMHYWLTGIIVLLVVIAINVILSLRTLHTLTELSVLLRDVTKVQQKGGQGKPTKSGGQA